MSFTDFTPQLDMKAFRQSATNSRNGTKGTAKDSAQIALKGSLTGRIQMMDIPSRDSINTETTRPADKQRKIKKGTL